MMLKELHNRSQELLKEVEYLINEFLVETGTVAVEFYKTSENELGIRIETELHSNWKIKNENNELENNMSQIEMSKEYKTRDGRSVRLLCTDGPFGFPVVGIIYNLDGSPWTAASWTLNGRIEGAIASSHLNLIEVRKKFRREVWVNVYPEDKLGGNVSAFNSKETADSMADGNPRIACIKVIIEGEEGEGL
jgi:hypothetical protein